MQLVYTGEPMPEGFNRSLFLAGPTSRSNEVTSWRPEALRILEANGYDGVVFVPEYHEGGPRPDYDSQVGWEHQAINMSDCVMFWVPRDLEKLPAFTTNVEFGWLVKSGKIVFGAPQNAPNMNYLRRFADKEFVPQSATLDGAVDAALKFLGEGSYRSGGARQIPLFIWNTRHFQNWYQAQYRAGNRLDGADVKTTFRVGKRKERLYVWMIHANVFVASENRNKTNEPVIGRLDISSVVLYRRGKKLLDTEVVLGREFRSPASNYECFIWEVPSGSNPDPSVDPLTVAVDELHEETGFKIEAARLKPHGARQLAGTLLTHKSNLYSAELTKEEMNWFRAQSGVPHGADLATNPSGERVYTEVVAVREILGKKLVDWSNVGMIFQVLQGVD